MDPSEQLEDIVLAIQNLYLIGKNGIPAAVEHFASRGIITSTEQSEIVGKKGRNQSNALKNILKTKDSHFTEILTYLNDPANLTNSNDNVTEGDGILTGWLPKINSKNKVQKRSLAEIHIDPKNFLDNFNPNKPECYPRPEKRKGYTVIINHTTFDDPKKISNRKGADKDEENMWNVLTNFGFKVNVLPNKTAKELKTEINNCIKTLSVEEYDSLIVVVGSHGHSDHFVTKNGKWMSCWTEIVEKFNCESLEGKPKIFLFNFCRGANVDQGVFVPKSKDGNVTDSTPVDTVSNAQSLSDVLVCFSTVDDYVSYRDINTGSVFLKYISQYFGSHGNSADICTILTKVSEEIKAVGSNKKQMCTYYNIGFSKAFYLR